MVFIIYNSYQKDNFHENTTWSRVHVVSEKKVNSEVCEYQASECIILLSINSVFIAKYEAARFSPGKLEE